jgi:hypothetical protein
MTVYLPTQPRSGPGTRLGGITSNIHIPLNSIPRERRICRGECDEFRNSYFIKFPFAYTDNLLIELLVYIGTQVILITNTWTENRLVNRSIGTIEDIL